MATTTMDKREARREEDRARLAAAVEALTSSVGWRQWAAVRRHFRRYSASNQWLIASQCPQATRVTGFKSWEALGRTVRRGEKAIRIIAPRTTKSEVEQADGSTKTERRTFFVHVPVFDVSQTEGDDLPTIVEPVLGDSHAGYIDQLVDFASTIGFTVEFRDIAGSASGWCDPDSKLIVLDSSLAPNARLAVLVHEIAHALGIGYQEYGRADAEVIVEAAAWLVCGTLGLDTSASSVGYIASWCSDQSTDQLRAHAGAIDKIARQIEAALLPLTEST